MTKKYILTLAISIGFFSTMEASEPEEVGHKTSKGVIFYENGKEVTDSTSFDLNKHLNTYEKCQSMISGDYSLEIIGSNSKKEKGGIKGRNTPLPEENKKNSINPVNSTGKSPSIPIKNSSIPSANPFTASESHKDENGFEVGSFRQKKSHTFKIDKKPNDTSNTPKVNDTLEETDFDLNSPKKREEPPLIFQFEEDF